MGEEDMTGAAVEAVPRVVAEVMVVGPLVVAEIPEPTWQ